jgi:hypothetical protein
LKPGFGRPVGGSTPVLFVGTAVAVLLLGNVVEVLFVGTVVAVLLLGNVVLVLFVAVVVPVVPILLSVVVAEPAPLMVFVLPPVAPTPVTPPKKATDGCSHAWLLMSGHCVRTKLGACAKVAWSALTVNTRFAPGIAPAARVSPLTRTRVHGIGTSRPFAAVRIAASAQPTGLKTMFSMRPSGCPATSITREPSTLMSIELDGSAVNRAVAAGVNCG